VSRPDDREGDGGDDGQGVHGDTELPGREEDRRTADGGESDG
jgi:hypothetical protein